MKKVLFIASAVILAGFVASCQKENPVPVQKEAEVVNVDLSDSKAGIDVAPLSALVNSVSAPSFKLGGGIRECFAKFIESLYSGDNGDGQTFDHKRFFWFHGLWVNQKITDFIKYAYDLNPENDRFIHLDLARDNKYSVLWIDVIFGTELSTDITEENLVYYGSKSVTVIWSYLGETYKIEVSIDGTNIEKQQAITGAFYYSILKDGGRRDDPTAYKPIFGYDGRAGWLDADIHYTQDDGSTFDMVVDSESNTGEITLYTKSDLIEGNSYQIYANIIKVDEAIFASRSALLAVLKGGIPRKECDPICDKWNAAVTAFCTFHGTQYLYEGGEYIPGEKTDFTYPVTLEPRGLSSEPSSDSWIPALFVLADQRPEWETGITAKYFNAIQMFSWTAEQWTEFYKSLPPVNAYYTAILY